MNTNAGTTTRQGSKQKERQKKRSAGEEYFTRKNNKKVPTKQPPENKVSRTLFLFLDSESAIVFTFLGIMQMQVQL